MNIIAKRIQASGELDNFFKGLGFEVMDTGGQGECYYLELPSGNQLGVSEFGGLGLPTAPDLGLSIAIYEPGDDAFLCDVVESADCEHLESVNELKDVVREWVAKG